MLYHHRTCCCSRSFVLISKSIYSWLLLHKCACLLCIHVSHLYSGSLGRPHWTQFRPVSQCLRQVARHPLGHSARPSEARSNRRATTCPVPSSTRYVLLQRYQAQSFLSVFLCTQHIESSLKSFASRHPPLRRPEARQAHARIPRALAECTQARGEASECQ